MQLIRAVQERLPNALIVNQHESQRRFRLDQRLLNDPILVQNALSNDDFVAIDILEKPKPISMEFRGKYKNTPLTYPPDIEKAISENEAMKPTH